MWKIGFKRYILKSKVLKNNIQKLSIFIYMEKINKVQEVLPPKWRSYDLKKQKFQNAKTNNKNLTN